jgi:hypothetical protein
MEATRFSLDHFDFVIDSFQLPRMNRIVAVIEDSTPVAQQGLGKLFNSWMVNGLGQQTPFLYGFLCPCPGPVGPDVFEFVFEDHHRIDDLVQLEQLFEVLSIFRLSDIPPIFHQKIFGVLEDVFVGLGGFPVFAVTHFIDDLVELGYHAEEIEDDLDMCVWHNTCILPPFFSRRYSLSSVLPFKTLYPKIFMQNCTFLSCYKLYIFYPTTNTNIEFLDIQG